jgi:flavorubredoxin
MNYIFSEDEKKNNSDYLFFYIKYDGIIYSRKLLIEFVDENPNYFDSNVKYEIQDTIEEWKTINTLLFKYNLMCSENDKYVNLSKRLEKNIYREKRIIGKIIK